MYTKIILTSALLLLTNESAFAEHECKEDLTPEYTFCAIDRMECPEPGTSHCTGYFRTVCTAPSGEVSEYFRQRHWCQHAR